MNHYWSSSAVRIASKSGAGGQVVNLQIQERLEEAVDFRPGHSNGHIDLREIYGY